MASSTSRQAGKPSRAAGGNEVTETTRTLFPWASVIRFGLARLRLTPQAFWALSLVELTALIGADDLPAMTTRQGLEALMAQFPDTRHKEEPDDDR